MKNCCNKKNYLKQTNMAAIITDHQLLFSTNQLIFTRKVNDLHHSRSVPLANELKTMVKLNLIKDMLVTVQNINLAEEENLNW